MLFKMFFLLAGAFFISCDYFLPVQRDPSAQAIQKAVGSDSEESGATNTVSANQWGIFKCQSDSETEGFNTHVKQFLSSGFNPSNYPAIGCMKQHGGGRMYFQGSVSFVGGATLDSSGNPGSGDLHVDSSSCETSFVEIHIDTKDSPKKVAPAIFCATATPGRVSSEGTAVLNFKDKNGEISLVGQIKGEFFEGRLEYDNNTTWEHTPTGYSGVFPGLFKIRTCQFFTCS